MYQIARHIKGAAWLKSRHIRYSHDIYGRLVRGGVGRESDLYLVSYEFNLCHKEKNKN